MRIFRVAVGLEIELGLGLGLEIGLRGPYRYLTHD